MTPDVAGLVHSQREYRAALYVDRLEATGIFLTTTLAGPATGGGLGADYPFVAAALTGGELLNQLAESLDEWVCPAVEPAVNAAIQAGGQGAPTDYTSWFTARIFDPNDATYQTNVRAFFIQYPITDHALTRITANFQNNIRTALRRVLADRAAITALFADRYNGLMLTGLSQITSTGSDFHKGGQQVLILSFSIKYWYGYIPRRFSTLKLVYKPGDVEIDCLIAGESAAVNRVIGGNVPFQVQSLVEVFNAEITAHPAPGMEPLPTYRILPRNPVSQQGGPPYPVRQAYGYLEYLSSYELYGMTWSAFSYYPLGKSDCVIFRGTSEAPVIERFYHQAGQFLALALAFSLVDLHIENVRVTAYQPHLIDLETSLTADIQNVSNTSLLDNLEENSIGGINGDSRANEAFVYRFAARNASKWELNQDFIPKWYDNRLWARRPDLRIVRVNAYWLLQGLTNGMSVIQAIQNAGGFTAWLNRAQNVLVRVLPVATTEWITARLAIYLAKPQLNGPPKPPAQLQPAVNQAQDSLVAVLFNNGNGNIPEPKYVAAAAGQVATDLTSFDIPAFYHRIGSAELLDSTGAVIQVPAQVTIGGNPVNTNAGRITYFAAPPTAARVLPRLTTIGAGTFANTVNYPVQTLSELRHTGPPPTGPGVLI